MFTIAECHEPLHSLAILEIFNEAIVHSTALYEYQPRNLDSMPAWFAEKQVRNFPVLGAFDGSGELLGFATYGTFRSKPAFKYTVEHSVYIHHAHRGKGLGRALLQAIINAAIEQEMHCMVGCIDSENLASIHLHEQFGFKYSGAIEQAGFKFGQWLDLAFYQLVLPTPQYPIEN